MIKDKKRAKVFYSKLDYYKISFNKENPIQIELFLPFLLCDTVKSTDNIGIDNGWGLYTNDDFKLKIKSYTTNNIEYLHRIEYGNNLGNPYNNNVNPFYIFDILSFEGKKFFIKYYKDDIDALLDDQKKTIKSYENRLKEEKEIYDIMVDEMMLLNRVIYGTRKII